MGISESLSRSHDTRCAQPGCAATWKADHQWATCRTCSRHPLAICPEHIKAHFDSPACQRSHKARGVLG